MDALLKPIMSLLPARKQAMRRGKQAATTGPAASMHHLLYAMRDLNPRFVAVAADLRVVRWPHGATDRPEVDAHIAEDLLVRQKDDEDDAGTAAAATSTGPAPAGSFAGFGGSNDDGDGAAAADGKDRGAIDAATAKKLEERAKARRKRQKGQQTWGFCLTQKGTVTFVNPDGLTKLSATVNRRDMERIEVCGARHCVDATLQGAKVTIVWTLPTNEIQRATKARDRFKAVAAEVLPDVEYTDVTPPDEEEEEEAPPPEDNGDAEEDAPPPLPHDEPPAAAEDDAGGMMDEAFEEEEAEEEDEASTEYEEDSEPPEPDEEPVDIRATVERLKHARDVSAETARRIFAAQKWLADNPLQTGDDGDGAAADDDGDDGSDHQASSAGAAPPLSGRDQALRLALMVNIICDKQRALAAAARNNAGQHSMRARYLESSSRARSAQAYSAAASPSRFDATPTQHRDPGRFAL